MCLRLIEAADIFKVSYPPLMIGAGLLSVWQLWEEISWIIQESGLHIEPDECEVNYKLVQLPSPDGSLRSRMILQGGPPVILPRWECYP